MSRYSYLVFRVQIPILSKSGSDSEEVTPVLMPNTEVKFFSADGSWGLPPARVGRRQAYFFTYLIYIPQ